MGLNKQELGEVLATRELAVFDWSSIVAATMIGLQKMVDFLVTEGHDVAETYIVVNQLDTAISIGQRVLKYNDEEQARKFFQYVTDHFDRWWD